MNYHSNSNSKETYNIGELIVTCDFESNDSESRIYQYGIVLEVIEKHIVNKIKFRNVYKILLQDSNCSTKAKIVERYSSQLYLPHMHKILNEELKIVRSRNGIKNTYRI